MTAQLPIDKDLSRVEGAAPQPKSGILDITPYKPGKATADGVAHPVKLSGNENILGSSPKAREAYLAAAGELNVYPDGRGGGVAHPPSPSDAASNWIGWRCLAAAPDELLHLINQTFLEPGDNIRAGLVSAFGAYGGDRRSRLPCA